MDPQGFQDIHSTFQHHMFFSCSQVFLKLPSFIFVKLKPWSHEVKQPHCWTRHVGFTPGSWWEVGGKVVKDDWLMVNFKLGVSKNRGGPPKWMVKIMENPDENGWLGGSFPTIFGVPSNWKSFFLSGSATVGGVLKNIFLFSTRSLARWSHLTKAYVWGGLENNHQLGPRWPFLCHWSL